MTDILQKPREQKVTLADGKEYTLPAINLNTMANLEEEFDCGLAELEKRLRSGRTATTFRRLIHVLLRENYPNMTLEEAGKLVEPKDVKDISDSLTKYLGKLKE